MTLQQAMAHLSTRARDRGPTRALDGPAGPPADFLDLHLFGRNLFVFNIADAAINLGVALLLLDALLSANRRSASPNKARQALSN